MLSEGSTTPIGFQTITSFGGSILSLKGLNFGESSSESFMSSSKTSESVMSELSIYTFFNPNEDQTRKSNVEVIEKNTCKCAIV